MIPKPLSQVDVADLEELVRNQVPEGKTLEYKRNLPTEAESSIIPFLAAVSAFANSSGGDLVIGIEEDRGNPIAIVGVEIEDLDKEMLRLDGMIRTGLEPRLPAHETKVVGISNGRYVIILRIQRSWFPPHRVSYHDHAKFYGRSNAGKYPLDVSELRAAFTLSEQVSERIRRFRVDRMISLRADETPVQLAGAGRLVLHLLPMSTFAPRTTVDVSQFLQDWSLLSPMGEVGSSRRLSFDGLGVFSGGASNRARGYTLLFRSGIIETVMVLGWDNKMIPGRLYEQDIREALPRFLKVQSFLGVGAPVYLTIALVGVRGYRMGVGERVFQPEVVVLDRDLLDLPEVVLDSLDVQPDLALRSSFDLIWNAFGFPASLNYDDKGMWKTRD